MLEKKRPGSYSLGSIGLETVQGRIVFSHRTTANVVAHDSRNSSSYFLVHAARFEDEDLSVGRSQGNGGSKTTDSTSDDDDTKLRGRNGHIDMMMG